ncbi:hypothetical protein Q1695_004305 [Nippostrongylus brasiliensis]|nr:hypothetical protein Q1695_004305 [Nippostrongylus brasiliensis]
MTTPADKYSLVYKLQLELQEAKQEYYDVKAQCREEQARGQAKLDHLLWQLMHLTNSIKYAEEELNRIHRGIEKMNALIRQKGLENEFKLWKSKRYNLDSDTK